MPRPYSLAEIASRLGGRIAGDAQTLIAQVGTLEQGGSGHISFLSNPKYRNRLTGTRAAAVIVSPEAETLTDRPRIVCDNPYAYFARVSQLLNPEPAVVPGIDPAARVAAEARVHASVRVEPGAVIEAGATIGEGCWIGANCYIGRDSVIGANSRLNPSVVIYAGCTLGARVLIHSGAVIGADGFGIARDEGRWVKIPQIGGVRIGDDVEIGASTTIDRGAMDDTIIEEGVKLDNQIQIGHNVRVGAHSAMAGCAAVAGSADIGRHCTIGAASLILGHLSIADHVDISAGTVVTKSILERGSYTGLYPFSAHATWKRNSVRLRQLAELADRVTALEKRLAGKEEDHD